MTHKDKIEFDKDVEQAYKATIKPLYLKWRQYSNGEVNEMFFLWVAKHHHQKIMDLYNRRKHRKLKTQKIKNELETLKLEKQLADPFGEANQSEEFKI